jgi:hypothetical protein
MVEQLDGANLDDAMAAQRVEPGCLGIDDDFTPAVKAALGLPASMTRKI